MENKDRDHLVITELAFGFEALREQEIIKANRKFLSKCFPRKTLSQLTASDLAAFMHRQEKLTPKNKKQRLGVQITLLMLEILQTRQNLQDPSKDFISNVYILSAQRHLFLSVSHDYERFEDVMNGWHKLKAQAGQMKRWNTEREKCIPAVEQGRALWRDGDLRNLPEILSYLLNKKEYKELHRKTLRAMLYPVAQEYKKLYDRKAPRAKNERKHI